MKRNEIVESLLKEGFSEKTLVKFSDKQLSDLHKRMIGESDVMISKKDPQLQQKVDAAKKQQKSIETYEEENVDVEDSKKEKKGEVKEWVKALAEENFHSFTSKNEIMELIKTKLNEVEVGPNVKKGHNGIPEFMSYDAITKTEVKEQGTTTKPKIKPATTPSKPKPKTPYQPGPGTDPKPKALKEDGNANK